MSTSEYNLVYVDKKTNEILHAKRIIPGHYSLINPITGDKKRITRAKLIKNYEFQEQVSMENVRRNSQPMVSKSA